MHDFDNEADVRQPLAREKPRSVDEAAIDIRCGFIRKVYGLLFAQICVTTAVAAYIVVGAQDLNWLRSHEWVLWVSVIGTFSTICAMSCCEGATKSYPTNYIFLFTFTFFEAVMIGFVSAVFTWQSLMLCVMAVGVIFLALTMYAFNTHRDFTGHGPYLFVALCAVCMFGLILAILPAFGVHVEVGIIIYDFIVVLLFSFYIVFDTQMMLGEYGGHQIKFGIDDYVYAALHLYLDIVNLFVALLSLLGQRNDNF